MPRRAAAILAAAALLMCAAGLMAARELAAADDPLASLNRVIQERFADVDETFGLRRIVVPDDTPHRFRPERVGESAAVGELEEAGLSVALYLAGRRILEREPLLLSKTPGIIDRRVIFGPVAVTPAIPDPSLPAAADLIEASRAAFDVLRRRDRYDVDEGGWTLTARAVRAAGATCLACHRGRQVGDVLGVVLYASRPRS